MSEKLSLPVGWRYSPFSSFLVPIERSFSVVDDEEYRLCGVRWYGNGAFIRETKIGKEIKIKGKHLIKDGDVIYNKLFAWKGSFAVVHEDLDGCCVSDEFPTFQVDSSVILPQYLEYFFLTDQIRQQSADQSRGVSAASRFRLHERDFLKLEIPLPSLEDQRRIVAKIMELEPRVEEVTKLQQDAIVESKSLTTSCLNSLFSEEHMASWEECALGDISEIVSGVTLGRKLEASRITVPYLRVANVQDGWLDLGEIKQVEIRPHELDKWRLLPGDLLLTEGGDFDKLGRGTVWNGEIPNCIHQNHIFRVRVDRSRILPEFLELEIQSSYGKDYFVSKAKKTTNLASINQTQLRAFPVRYPHLQEQIEIVNRARKFQRFVDQLSENQEQSLLVINAVLPSFLDRAFRGELI